MSLNQKQLNTVLELIQKEQHFIRSLQYRIDCPASLEYWDGKKAELNEVASELITDFYVKKDGGK